MTTHVPQNFATNLGAKLATRSRHVCALLGAGAGKACGLPDVKGLESGVIAKLKGEQRKVFVRLLDGRNIEEVLSRIRRIAGLLSGNEEVDGLTKARADELDKSLCQAIVGELDIKSANIAPMRHLASWVKRANYRYPLELFTVNYDLLIETALESHGVPYFDGFAGNLRARFRDELVEALPDAPGGVPSLFARLWKLHGSVNWERAGKEIVRIGQPVSTDLPAAIYPSDAKYLESRRVPFLVLQDRFGRALHQSETLVLISGFNFGDDHLNEMIFDAAGRRERSEFVVFRYGAIPDELAERAKAAPNMQVVSQTEAILCGERGPWKPPDADIQNVWEDGKFVMPDFAHLAAYLARSTSSDNGVDDA